MRICRNFAVRSAGAMMLAGCLISTTLAEDSIQIDATVYRVLPDGSKEILAQPRVVTQNGKWANFQEVEEITWATEFNQPNIPVEFAESAASDSADEEVLWETNERHAVIPAHPTKFEAKEHGLKIKLRPRLGNGDNIFVDCQVEQISFDGYVDNAPSITFEIPRPFGNKPEAVTVEDTHTRLPTFRTRQQEFLFSPNGDGLSPKLISDASTSTTGSTASEQIPGIQVSLKARKIPIETRKLKTTEERQIYVTTRFLESPVPLNLDTLVLTDPEFQLWVRKVATTKGLDLLNAPSVMLKNGESNKLEVIREFIYPTQYDPPELPNDSFEPNDDETVAFPLTPASPTEFDVVNVGVSVQIKAREVANGQIELDLSPNVVSFEGFENLGAPVYVLSKNSLGKYEPIVLTENRIEMPRFKRHQLNYTTRIADGDAIIVRGIIRHDSQTIETKVPVLGDLPLIGRFGRKTTTEELERHVYIAIRAQMMDSTGISLRE